MKLLLPPKKYPKNVFLAPTVEPEVAISEDARFGQLQLKRTDLTMDKLLPYEKLLCKSALRIVAVSTIGSGAAQQSSKKNCSRPEASRIFQMSRRQQECN